MECDPHRRELILGRHRERHLLSLSPTKWPDCNSVPARPNVLVCSWSEENLVQFECFLCLCGCVWNISAYIPYESQKDINTSLWNKSPLSISLQISPSTGIDWSSTMPKYSQLANNNNNNNGWTLRQGIVSCICFPTTLFEILSKKLYPNS